MEIMYIVKKVFQVVSVKVQMVTKKMIFYATCSRYSAISHLYKFLFPERNSELSLEKMQ